MKKHPLTPGQKKLQTLSVKLPYLPLTLSGSLPKPPEIRELRYKVAKRVQPRAELERKEKLAAELWIREQERYHFDVLVDGEIDRSDLISHFASRINGFSPGGLVRCYGNRYYRKPVITGKLEAAGPIMADSWHFSQRLTNKPLKAILTGPYTLMDWSFNEFYPSRDNICEELTGILRKEIIALIDLGVKIVQIDEPALSTKPADFHLAASCWKTLIAGLKPYFILHNPFSNLAPVWDKLLRLPFDNISLGCIHPDSSFLQALKRASSLKDFTAGVIEAHNHLTDTPRQLGERIRAILKAIDPHHLWFSSDSGLKTRSNEEALQKMKALSAVVAKFRQKK